MTEDERIARMAELAQRANRLPEGDPALGALLMELEALARILPASDEMDVRHEDAEQAFDNMPV